MKKYFEAVWRMAPASAICGFGAMLMLSACGVTPPRVSYGQGSLDATSNTSTDGYFFRLRRSVILISTDDKGALTTTASPTEFSSDGKSYTTLYKISGRDDAWSTTQIKISYLDNTKEPDQITFTTTNNVGTTIDKIGTLGAAVAPVLAGLVSGTQTGEPKSEFHPTRIDPGDPAAYDWQEDVLNPGYCMRLSGVIEEPGVTPTDFFAQRSGATARDFPAPACASAEVQVTKCTSANTIPANTKDLTIMRTTYASSRLVLPTPIPSSGTIKFNSVCGVSIASSDNEDRVDLLTYLQKVVKSGTDIQNAWNKAKGGK